MGERLKEIKLNRELMDLAFDIYNENLLKSSEGKDLRKQALREEITQISKKLDRLLDLRIEGSIDEDIFKQKTIRILPTILLRENIISATVIEKCVI